MFAFVCLVIILVIFKNPRNHPDFSDFQVYIEAGRKALEHHTVYDVEGHYQYKYAPFVALVFGALFGRGDGAVLTWSFYFVSAAMWGILIVSIIRWSDTKDSPPMESVNLFFFIAALFSVPLRNELKLGQINWLPMGLMLGASRLIKNDSKRAEWGAGFLLGLAVQVKLFALILLGDWFWRRKWSAFAGCILSYLLCNWVLLIVYYGWQHTLSENLIWISSLTQSSSELLNSKFNVSIIGYLAKWNIKGNYIRYIWLMTALAVIWMQRLIAKKCDSLSALAFAWIFVLILNPIAWPYWLLLGLPAVVLSTRSVLNLRAYRSAIVLIIAVGTASFLQNDQYVWFYGGDLWAAIVLLAFMSQPKNKIIGFSRINSQFTTKHSEPMTEEMSSLV
jgi:hypothetical protein